MKVPNAPVTLYTIAMSHYSEKIRWLLDVEGVEYREVALTPFLHATHALLMGMRGQTTVPLLRIGQQTVQDSTRIIEWLANDFGPLTTLPPASRTMIMEIEDRFDSIGKEVARYLYFHGFDEKDHILYMWTKFASPFQTRLVKLIYPLIKAVFRSKLRINEAQAAKAEKRIAATLDLLDAQLADGKTYLAGGCLTVADITAAALLAPLAGPAEHPLYGEAAFREKMTQSTPALQAWQSRPSLQWVRKIYAQHRGVVWKNTPTCS